MNDIIYVGTTLQDFGHNPLHSFYSGDAEGSIPEFIECVYETQQGNHPYGEHTFYDIYMKTHKDYNFWDYEAYISRYSFLCVDVSEININNIDDYLAEKIGHLRTEFDYYRGSNF